MQQSDVQLLLHYFTIRSVNDTNLAIFIYYSYMYKNNLNLRVNSLFPVCYIYIYICLMSSIRYSVTIHAHHWYIKDCDTFFYIMRMIHGRLNNSSIALLVIGKIVEIVIVLQLNAKEILLLGTPWTPFLLVGFLKYINFQRSIPSYSHFAICSFILDNLTVLNRHNGIAVKKTPIKLATI